MKLYSGTRNASSWAFRAWLALKECGLEFNEEIVDIRPPQRYANLSAVGVFSPPAAVPVLVDGDDVIFDSLAIMEYANELDGGRLLPADMKKRARARSLLAWQHSGLSNLCPRLSFESSFYPDQRDMSLKEVGEARRVFQMWESELGCSDGPYLAGDLSLADLAFVPTVMRLFSHMASLEKWPLSCAWEARLMARESVVEWVSEARALPVVRLTDYRP